MPELIAIVGCATAAMLLWRALAAWQDPVYGHALATFGFRPPGPAGAMPIDLHVWPAQDRFDFAIVDTERHQAALRAALAAQGELCVAILHSSREVGGPVEVRVGDQRVGFLSDGDATRYQRRLAFEARPGQTSQCGARIVPRDDPSRRGEKPFYTLVLDLKPFRH